MMTQELLEHMLLTLSLMHYSRFQIRDLHSVLFRIVLSTQSITSTTWLRTPHQLSLVSVIQIWLKRWLTTARTTFLLRQVSLCLHRLISLTRVYSHSFSNYNYYMIYLTKGTFGFLLLLYTSMQSIHEIIFILANL